MTAYGKSAQNTPIGRITVEIHSVNRKHLEVVTFFSKELLRYETLIKNIISEEVSRGAVQVKIHIAFDQVSPIKIVPNLPLVKQLKDAWNAIAKELGVEKGFDLSLLLHKENNLFTYEEEQHDEGLFSLALTQAVKAALIPYQKMKGIEGIALYKDIDHRLTLMRKALDEIKKRAEGSTERQRNKLIEKLKEFSTLTADHEDRLLREVILYAERVDISEEITRFESHLVQFKNMLDSNKNGVGKTLEFLVQEFLRETNTIGSKALDVEITKQVIEIKSELEKVREQLQNVE